MRRISAGYGQRRISRTEEIFSMMDNVVGSILPLTTVEKVEEGLL